MRAALPWMVLAGCTQFVEPGAGPGAPQRWGGVTEDFPAARDLAIVFPLEAEARIGADTAGLLPQPWVDTVGEAFVPTVVGEGFQEESWYEDWRLVSVRVVPCAPLAPRPAVAPASVCWPAVRLVWQPVVGFMERGGVPLDAWAEDRALHAIYPLAPRDRYGRRVDGEALEALRSALADGIPHDALPVEVQGLQDATLGWLLEEVEGLRDADLSAGLWTGVGLRPELLGSDLQAEAFTERLVRFLTLTASPSDLKELTAFSLPAGRQPSGDDAWVFVAFDARDGVLTSRRLEVMSRRTGEVLVDYGWSQDAGQAREAPEVEAALAADPSGELHETVVGSTEEVSRIEAALLDPEAVFVPNTTCATCHRLNDLRFDFHALSSLEDADPTVSPRVVADVAFELAWLRGAAAD